MTISRKGNLFMSKEPKLSIVIASYNSVMTIGTCLDSLAAQACNAAFEIIVVDSSSDGTAELIAKRFPDVKLHRFKERKYAGDARNIGIGAARAALIAFIDADCTAEVDWIEKILLAHKLPHPAIGGAIANANPNSAVGWAAYFTEFSQWMPKTPAHISIDIAAANMSYKKELFADLGGFIEGTYCSDTEFHWRLKRSGKNLFFDPSIRINHQNIDRLGNLLGHEFHHGQSFARVRVKAKEFSVLSRSIYAALFPGIFTKLLINTAQNNLKNRVYLSQFIKTLPLLSLGLLSWSLGECMGYVKGELKGNDR